MKVTSSRTRLPTLQSDGMHVRSANGATEFWVDYPAKLSREARRILDRFNVSVTSEPAFLTVKRMKDGSLTVSARARVNGDLGGEFRAGEWRLPIKPARIQPGESGKDLERFARDLLALVDGAR